MWDAFWRAAAYCLHPLVVAWSLLPLLLAGALAGGLGWTYWEAAVDGVRAALDRWALTGSLLGWLDSVGARQLRVLVAPLVVVALAVPVVVLVTLTLVALLVTPAVVRLVAARRFPALQAHKGASAWQGLGWTLVCALAALLALLASVPLWFVPPFLLLLPPLIWGWLTCRVMGFDVLAHHASAQERRALLRGRRWTLLLMGLLCGALGALPAALWAVSAATLIFAPLMVLVSVWLYTGVFAFAACWFAHYLLNALHELRRGQAPQRLAAEPVPSTSPSTG